MKGKDNETNSDFIGRCLEARIALCKCKESNKVYGVRMEKARDGWNCTWAFPISQDSAKREGYDTTVLMGNIIPTKDYNGCPYCGAKYFVVCSACKKLNCQTGEDEVFKCEWCGKSGKLMSYDGGGVESGGDI